MISNICLDNYTSFESDNLKLKPLTILYGPNGAGKTNILKSPLLIKQSLYHNFRTLDLVNKYVSLSVEGIQNHEGSAVLSFRFSLADEDEFFELFCDIMGMSDKRSHIDKFEIEVKLTTGDGIRNHSASLFKGIKGMDVEMVTFFSNKADKEYAGKAIKSVLRAVLLSGYYDTYQISLLNAPCERKDKNGCKCDGLKSGYSFEYKDMEFNLNIGKYQVTDGEFTLNKLRDKYGNDLKITYLIYRAIQELFGQVEFIGDTTHVYFGESSSDYEVVPFEATDSHKSSKGNIEVALGESYDDKLNESGNSNERLGFNVEGKKVGLIDAVKDWVRHIGLGELEVVNEGKGAWESQYHIKINGRYLQGLGSGINKLMTIIVGGLSNQYCGTLLLEQPEAGVSSKLQLELADFILDGVVKRGKQVVIETHSDHIINRIVRRAMENDNVYDLIQIYYIHKDKDGHSEVTPIEIDNELGFSDLPDSLFEEYNSECKEILNIGYMNLRRRKLREEEKN